MSTLGFCSMGERWPVALWIGENSRVMELNLSQFKRDGVKVCHNSKVMELKFVIIQE